MTDPIQAAAPVPEAAAPALSQVERVVDTFIAPSKTFTDIIRNQSWWLPFLLGIIVSYGMVFAMQSKVGWDKLAENSVKQSPKAAEQLDQLPPDQRAARMKLSATITKYIYYGLPILSLLMTAIFALVLWGTINFGFGGRATFGQVFAVWMYGSLPLLLQSILAIIALFTGLDADSFNMQNPAGTNIGYYLAPDTPKWLMTFATAIDPVWIWAYFLVGIGLAIVAGVKKSSGLIAVFGWWILLLIVRMGIAAAMG